MKTETKINILGYALKYLVMAVLVYYSFKVILLIGAVAEISTEFIKALDMDKISLSNKIIFVLFSWWFGLNLIKIILEIGFKLIELPEKEHDFLRLVEKYKIKRTKK